MKKGFIKWAILLAMLVVYVLFKFKGMFGANMLNVIVLGMAVLIASFKLEDKICCLFLFLPFYLYVYLKSFAFFNVVVILTLGHYLLYKQKINVPIAALSIILFLLELLWHGSYPIVSYTYIIKWFLAFFLSMSLISDAKLKIDKSLVGFFFCVGVTLLGAFTMMQYGTFSVNEVMREELAGGLSSLDQNTYSLYCVLGFAIAAYFLLNKSARTNTVFDKKPYGLVAFALMAVIDLIAGALMVSKTYFLVLAFWIVLLLITSIKNPNKFLPFITIIVLGVAVAFVIPQTRQIINKVLFRFTYNSEDIAEITTGRTIIFKQYFNGLVTNPFNAFFGSGLFSYNYFYDISQSSASGAPMITHNMTLEIICAYGFVGFAILVTAYVKYFKKRQHKQKIEWASVIPMLVFLLFAQALALYREDATQFIILLCMIVATPNLVKKEVPLCKN